MCDVRNSPINIAAQMNPQGRMPLRSSRSGGCMDDDQEYMSPMGRNSSDCYDHPRPDCKPPLPPCPLGIYVERAQPFAPDRRYEAPSHPFDGVSSYREDYNLKCLDRAKSFKPIRTFDPSQDKMDGISSYRAAYTPKPSMPYQKPSWSKKAEFEPSCYKMDGVTTYRVDYKGCAGERVRSMKPDVAAFDPSRGKMDGATTYRTNYIPYCSMEYKYAKQPQTMKDVSPKFSCSPMEGQTTYRTDFLPKCCVKRESMKPSNKTRFSDAHFVGCTTYRNDFNPFHFQKCVGPCIPVCAQTCPDDRMFAGGDGESPASGCRPSGMRGSCGDC